MFKKSTKQFSYEIIFSQLQFIWQINNWLHNYLEIEWEYM
jgi:hypothetical protein